MGEGGVKANLEEVYILVYFIILKLINMVKYSNQSNIYFFLKFSDQKAKNTFLAL